MNWQNFNLDYKRKRYTLHTGDILETTSQRNIFPVRRKQSPIPNAQIVFTDGSANGKASIVTKNHQKVLETRETSSQRPEPIL